MALIALVVAASGLGAGMTSGAFNATSPAQHDTFTAGTVSLNTTASTACSIGTGTGQTAGPLFPGTASTGWSSPGGSAPPCSLAVTYTGNLPGFVGIDVVIASAPGTLPAGVPAGTTPTPLYDGTPSGLQLQLSDTRNGASNYYVKGTNFTAQGGTPPPSTAIPSITCPSGFTGDTCFGVSNLLVSSTAFAQNNTDTFSLNFELPSATTSGNENATATVVLSVHAVQASNNALPLGCTALVQCSTGFKWS